MFLDKLIILADEKVVREVSFKKGINLIIDSSVSDKTTESGNSVGKTTVLRMVDFCFGSDGDDIYKDQEFERSNRDVEGFLKNKHVTAILEVVVDSRRMILTRGFGEPEIFRVDDVEYSNASDYRKALEIRVFNITGSRPSLRQLIPKFIRKDNTSMSRAVKYCHTSTSDVDYELIYSYFFDFPIELAKARFELKKLISKTRKRITALKDGATLPALRQTAKIIGREIKELEEKKNLLNIDKVYDEKLAQLQGLKKISSGLSRQIASLETEIQMHYSTLDELKTNTSQLNSRAIQEMYKEAGLFFEKLNKDFDSLLNFHNNLINTKLVFVERGLNEKLEVISKLKAELSKILLEESQLLKVLSKEGALDGVEILYSDLVKKYEEKGRREQLIEEIEEAQQNQKNVEGELKKLDDKYQSGLLTLDRELEVFNEYFSGYAKQLYDENFVFTYDDEGETLKFFIDNMAGNSGSGKKKACIGAFDFAFMSYFVERGKKLPRFVLHDGIEDIADNQIRTLFSMASKQDGQYVLSVIKDRLAPLGFGDEFFKENVILTLNEEDKFFKFV